MSYFLKWYNRSKTGHNWSCFTVLILSAIIFFCLTLELCTRIEQFLRFGAPFIGVYSSSVLRSGGANVPNARFEKWRNNSLGFRGSEINVNKKIGTTRVVCMGASETYGLYESAEKEWPRQLKSLLPPQYEVVNTSVTGLSLKNYSFYMNKHVFPLAPDVVVLVVNPLFTIGNQKRDPVPKQSEPEKLRKDSDSSNTARLIPSFRFLTKSKQIVKQLLATNFPVLLQKYQVWSLSKEIAGLEATKLKGRKPFDVMPEEDLQRFRSDLKSLICLIKTHKTKVIVCTYPHLISNVTKLKHPEIIQDNRRFFVDLSFNGMMDVLKKTNEAISEIPKEGGVSFVDVASRIPKTTEYFGDNVHYTDKGSRLFAEAVSEQILAESDSY